jgi:hypothetical protein
LAVQGGGVSMGRALPKRRRPLVWAIVVSLVAHVLVLGILARQQRVVPMAQAPTIEVDLVGPTPSTHLPTLPPIHETSPRSDGGASRAPEARTVAKADAAPPVVIPRAPAPSVSSPLPLPSPTTAQPGALQGALRNSLGCREAILPTLSPEERRKCEDQLADRLAGGGGRYGMDPAKRAAIAAEAREREPFLARIPKDNCVPQLSQKDVGQGAKAVHEWKFRTACAKSF